MARYFIQVHDGQDVQDMEGMEFSSPRTAQIEAIRLAGELLQDQPSQFCDKDNWSLEVTNADGLTIFTLHVLSNLAPARQCEIVLERQNTEPDRTDYKLPNRLSLGSGGVRTMPKTEPQKATAVGASVGQYARFLETARTLGCDEDEAAFDEKLKGIAGQKPKDASPPKD